jgi:hypothetical protein
MNLLVQKHSPISVFIDSIDTLAKDWGSPSQAALFLKKVLQAVSSHTGTRYWLIHNPDIHILRFFLLCSTVSFGIIGLHSLSRSAFSLDDGFSLQSAPHNATPTLTSPTRLNIFPPRSASVHSHSKVVVDLWSIFCTRTGGGRALVLLAAVHKRCGHHGW